MYSKSTSLLILVSDNKKEGVPDWKSFNEKRESKIGQKPGPNRILDRIRSKESPPRESAEGAAMGPFLPKPRWGKKDFRFAFPPSNNVAKVAIMARIRLFQVRIIGDLKSTKLKTSKRECSFMETFSRKTAVNFRKTPIK